jgi:Mg-chelatase subunit ChlD
MILKLPDGHQQLITLILKDVSLGDALGYVAAAASLKVRVEPYGVTLLPLNESVPTEPQPSSTPSPTPNSAYRGEVPSAKQPVSTFSLHVSDVSFQLAKDALAKGAMPDAGKIRTEEFYNAFDYNDPSPAAGEEVACRIEQAAHPFLQQRDLVRIALKVAAAGRDAAQPLRLTILLDTSGSMEREDRAASVRAALQALASLLGPNDRVTLIGFARTPRLLAEQVPGNEAGKLVELARRTPSEGGTNLELALKLASELALKQKLPAAQNRIVLLTDGAANLGNANPAELSREIEKARQQGISFDACGVGAKGLNDEVLETLTRQGDGRYYFLNKPEDADAGFARQLAGAFRPAAENVKVQVVFNPARVGQYRLLGFEKHLLKEEDFRNDRVQAAELSAEEAGVALYQVETLPGGEGDLGQVFVRFRDPATSSMVERSWPMPYEAKAPTFDQAAPSLQLATTAALLAEKLRGDSQVDLDALAPVAAGLRGHYPHQARVGDLIQMLERVRR